MKGVTWTNLDAFKAQLSTLAADLVEEADGILQETAEAAQVEIIAAYPRVTGNLRRGVKLRKARGSFLGGAILKQTAPHGHLYEHGTVVRYTDGGAHRGRMSATPTFGPIAAAHQRRAMVALSARIKAHGAERVEGDPDWSATSRML